MRLNTTHDCWHGAVDAYDRWVLELAYAAGYELLIIADVPMGRRVLLIDWGHVTQEQVFGEWETTPEDPLMILLVHSNSEGRITARDARPLAERLEGLIDQLPAEPNLGYLRDWRKSTERFVAGLRLAAEAGEDVEFH